MLDYAARTEAVRGIALQAKVSAYVVEQRVPDGTDVKAGDLLYRLDPRDFQVALDQAKAQFAAEQAVVQSRLLRSTNAVDLYVALGGGLSAESTDRSLAGQAGTAR